MWPARRTALCPAGTLVARGVPLCVRLGVYIRPPPYKREVWHFEEAGADLIKRSIESFNWEKSFADLEIDQQVDLLTSTLLNIFHNFIPHETVNCKDKNPPWITKKIKSSLQRKNRMYKKIHL